MVEGKVKLKTLTNCSTKPHAVPGRGKSGDRPKNQVMRKGTTPDKTPVHHRTQAHTLWAGQRHDDT